MTQEAVNFTRFQKMDWKILMQGRIRMQVAQFGMMLFATSIDTTIKGTHNSIGLFQHLIIFSPSVLLMKGCYLSWV